MKKESIQSTVEPDEILEINDWFNYIHTILNQRS
jgi:hypothetical protein